MVGNTPVNDNNALNNNIVNPQQVIVIPPALLLRDLQMLTIATNPSRIRLSNVVGNYELKNFHHHIPPTFNGLGTKNALGFSQEFYTTVHSLIVCVRKY